LRRKALGSGLRFGAKKLGGGCLSTIIIANGIDRTATVSQMLPPFVTNSAWKQREMSNHCLDLASTVRPPDASVEPMGRATDMA
jgi:hypothetical protein